jgi:hypothetical protein
MRDPVCQGRHLRWVVRAADTAPKAQSKKEEEEEEEEEEFFHNLNC